MLCLNLASLLAVTLLPENVLVEEGHWGGASTWRYRVEVIHGRSNGLAKCGAC